MNNIKKELLDILQNNYEGEYNNIDEDKAVEQINSYIENLLNPPFKRLDLESIGYVKDENLTNYFKLKKDRYYICVKVFELKNKNSLFIEIKNDKITATIINSIAINSMQEFNKLIEQLNL